MLNKTTKYSFYLAAATAIWVGVGVSNNAINVLAAAPNSVQDKIDKSPMVAPLDVRGAELRTLSSDALRELVAFGIYGNLSSKFIDEVWPENIMLDDVVIAGIAYTLVFVSADDVAGWDTYKAYMPSYVQKPTASGVLPTDEQVSRHLRRLMISAKDNFNALAAEELKVNRPAFNARFPSDWTDAQVRNSVSEAYKFDGNGDIAPVAQRAYNEYASLLNLYGALELYTRIKPKL